jgi:hypothetical protein
MNGNFWCKTKLNRRYYVLQILARRININGLIMLCTLIDSGVILGAGH